MDLTKLTIFGGVAAIAAFWGQFRAMLQKLFSFFVRTDSINNYALAKIVARNIVKRSKVMRWGNREYQTGYYFLRPFNLWGHVPYLRTKGFLAFYKGRIPVLVSDSRQGIKIAYLFKTFNFDKLLENSFAEFMTKERDEEDDNFWVDQISGTSGSPPPNSKSTRSKGGGLSFDAPDAPEDTGSGILSDIHVMKSKACIVGLNYEDIGDDEPDKRKEFYWSEEGLKLLDEVLFWKSSEKWYDLRNIIWRRGALLTGPTGTGKSKLVLETAKRLKMPLYKINLSSMDDTEFMDAMEGAPYGSIVLMEDIDVIFNGRVNILAEKSLMKKLLSFDTLINAMSGVKQKNGIFTIVTTNNRELLDSALIRPGRLDAELLIGPLDENGRKYIAANILCDWPELMAQSVIDGTGDTASAFESRCIEIALTKFYENRNYDSPNFQAAKTAA